MASHDFRGILRCLVSHGVDFIVVGGVSAVLNGAPINTFDLDLVHSTEPENVQRLIKALDELDAFYRAQPSRLLKPTPAHLASPGHQLLITRFGPLDLLGTIGRSHSYEDLSRNSTNMDLGDGTMIRVLHLKALIAIKEEVGAEKDASVLPILRRVLEEQDRS